MPTTQRAMNGRAANISTVSDSIDISSTICKDPIRDDERNYGNEDEDPKNFTIPIYKKFKIRICKPLIPLKLALFVWYGAGSAAATFLILLLKNKGITMAEVSTIYAISPAVQFLGPSICGIIADKIGRSKPILVVNLLLTILVVVGMLAAPNILDEDCPVKLKCHRKEFGRLIAKTSCDVNMDVIHLDSCILTCPENVTQHCHGQNLICEILEGRIVESVSNFSLSVHVSYSNKLDNLCYYNVTSMSHKNTTYSWCSVPHKMYCNIICVNPEEDCDNSGRFKMLVLHITLVILFFTVVSNTYRIMDVTSMALVKEHNSDFGRERFFAVAGILVFSPIVGQVVDMTTTSPGYRNYDSAFYFMIGMVFLLLIVTYKLEVQVKPPGKKMWKKSFYLLKNPDVIIFILVLIILGTAWGFTKNFVFLYLEEMKPPVVLLGLINSVSALYGLPFLFTSNWWVMKIGTTQILILGLLGYVASGIGYSLLYDPWLSLVLEAANIVTYHLLWVAVIVHSHSIAPEGLVATVISLAGAIHFSIGKGTGGFVYGRIMDAYGGRIAYRVMAMICLLSAVFYAIYVYVRKTCYTGNHTLDIRNGNESTPYEPDDAYKESYVMKCKY